MIMTVEQAKVMVRIFRWAYSNNISTTLSMQRDWDETPRPVLTFSRNGRSIQELFYNLTEVGKYFDSGAWKRIALELSVVPFNKDEEFLDENL